MSAIEIEKELKEEVKKYYGKKNNPKIDFQKVIRETKKLFSSLIKNGNSNKIEASANITKQMIFKLIDQ